MNHFSKLLLQIISDIINFSKIKSEQLKIEPREFSCLDIITHIANNFVPLVIKASRMVLPDHTEHIGTHLH